MLVLLLSSVSDFLSVAAARDDSPDEGAEQAAANAHDGEATQKPSDGVTTIRDGVLAAGVVVRLVVGKVDAGPGVAVEVARLGVN